MTQGEQVMSAASAHTIRDSDGAYCCDLHPSSAAEIFQSHRPRLFRVAYGMLESRAEAEDLLQDAYLRWHASATQDIQSPIAFLVTLTRRLCVDRLRELKQERKHHVGRRLSLVAEDQFPSPEFQLELAGEVAFAFIAVLERLGPDERVAFLLHDVFDYDYPEVAQMLGKAEPTCRQMIHRARARVRDSKPRFSVSAEARERTLGKFHAAIRTGDRRSVMALLAEDIEYVDNGRGKARALHVPFAKRGERVLGIPTIFVNRTDSSALRRDISPFDRSPVTDACARSSCE